MAPLLEHFLFISQKAQSVAACVSMSTVVAVHMIEKHGQSWSELQQIKQQ